MTYVHDESNPGVSAAYNKGADFASKHQKRWLLLLDQDTEFPTNALNRYWTAMFKTTNDMLFVPVLTHKGRIVSPFKYWHARGIALKRIDDSLLPLANYLALNSGLLVGLDVFSKAGGYDNSFPLDFSDFAFLLRAKAVADHLCVVDLTCQHDPSNLTEDSFKRALARFENYCLALRRVSKYMGCSAYIPFFAIVRSLKLAWHWKSLRFITIAIGPWRTR